MKLSPGIIKISEDVYISADASAQRMQENDNECDQNKVKYYVTYCGLVQ